MPKSADLEAVPVPRDGFDVDQDPIRRDAMRAQKRTELEMLTVLHRDHYFDAGMSFYCKVCGNRSQSMQPGPDPRHRPGCPLIAVAARVVELGGWPESTVLRLEFKAQGRIDRETAHVAREAALHSLAELWDAQQATFPPSDAGKAGAAAVRLCAKELREVLPPKPASA